MTRDRLLATATFRFGLAYAGLFTLSVALVAALAYAGMSRALELQVRGAVRAALEELQQRSDAGGEGSLRQAVADLVARRRSSPFVYAYLDPRHRLLAGDDVTPADAGPGWLRFEAPALARDEREPRSFLGRAVRLGDGGLLVVARDVDEVDDFRETLLAGAAWTVAATLLLAVGVGVSMGRFVLGRIDAVTATAARIVAGDLGHRVPLSGSGDEFDRLAAQINAMLDRIGGLMAGLRQVTDDVAHDLRTPLGRLRNRLEAMLRHDDVAEGLREETAQALAEADGMLDTFGALLRIAQIEGGTSRAGFREVDLSRLVGGVVEGYAAVAEDRGQTLAATVARDVRVRGDPELLTQLLVNLVENGLRHTPPGSTVTVTLARRDGGAEAVVADDGPGIPAGERDRVLRRFARLEASRSTPGSGLGLSLVAAIAGLHGIALRLGDNRPGLAVSLGFPACDVRKDGPREASSPRQALQNFND